MANRQFTQFRYSMEKAVVDLFAEVTIGATGAPTLVVAKSKAIAAIARNSAGDYTLTLQDNYYRLLGFDCAFQVATTPAAADVSVKTDAVTSGSLTFVCSTGGVATDPASGEIMKIKISLSNSSAI